MQDCFNLTLCLLLKWCLLIAFVKSLDHDQAPQNVGPDIWPQTFWHQKEFFEKVDFEKNQLTTKKYAKLPHRESWHHS